MAETKEITKSEILADIEIDGKPAHILRIAPDDFSDQDLVEHARNLAETNATPRTDIPDSAQKQKARETIFRIREAMLKIPLLKKLAATDATLDAFYPDTSAEEHFKWYSKRGSVEKGDQGSFTRRMSQGRVFGIEMDGRIAAVMAYDDVGKTQDGRPVLEFSKGSTLDQYKGKKLNPNLMKFMAEYLQNNGEKPIWYGSSVNPKLLGNMQTRGWHITEMNAADEPVQLAYQRMPEYIDQTMIPQGYKAFYVDPKVDNIDWGV
ncbi:MAG: hypothetical protein AAB373_00150 [Patescibacteria group bacterium]